MDVHIEFNAYSALMQLDKELRPKPFQRPIVNK